VVIARTGATPLAARRMLRDPGGLRAVLEARGGTR